MTQADIARRLGVSPALVSVLKKRGMPVHSAEAAAAWRRQNVDVRARAYAPPPPEAAPPPLAVDGERLDLAQERALLIRAQRQEVEGRLRLAAGEYAPISLLAQVLADASAAVVGHLEHLPARIKRACPLLPARALDEVQAVVVAARNEWVRSTCELVAAKIDEIDDGDEPEPT
jgi:phage terminase Nu1 subunit (DNA packaging protein)